MGGHHLNKNKSKCHKRSRTSDKAAIIRMSKQCNSLVHYAHLKEQSSSNVFISAHQRFTFKFILSMY